MNIENTYHQPSNKGVFALLVVIGTMILASVRLNDYLNHREFQQWKATARQGISDRNEVMFFGYGGYANAAKMKLVYPSKLLPWEAVNIRLECFEFAESIPVGSELVYLSERFFPGDSVTGDAVQCCETLDEFMREGLLVRLRSDHGSVVPSKPVPLTSRLVARWEIRSITTADLRVEFLIDSDTEAVSEQVAAVSATRFIPIIEPPIHYVHFSGREVLLRYSAYALAAIFIATGLLGLFVLLQKREDSSTAGRRR